MSESRRVLNVAFPPIADRRRGADAGPMIEVEISRIEIDGEGKLRVEPASGDYSYIYRAGRGVGWDPVRSCLYAPKPDEWSYLLWLQQIVDAVADEYGVKLTPSAATTWANVPDNMRSEMSSFG